MADPGVIGRNVARMRAERGWTQSELSRRSGVSQSFISDLEGGRRGKATTEVAASLAKAFGVTVDELLREGDRE